MELKKILMTGLASTLLLAACDDDASDTETNLESEEVQDSSTEDEEVVEEDTATDVEEDTEDLDDEVTADEDESEDVEEVTEDDENLPDQQVGDVIESEGMSRTVIATNYGIDESIENGPFTVTLLNSQVSHLEIDDEEAAEYFDGDDLVMVSLQLEVTNDSSDTNSIYPDQGTIVTNTGKQVDADIWMSDSVGGDFYGEVTKDGDVFFFFEGEPEEITNVRYIVRSGHDEDYESFGDDIEFSIDF